MKQMKIGKMKNLMLYFLDCPGKAIPEYVHYQLKKYAEAGIGILLFRSRAAGGDEEELTTLREKKILMDFISRERFSSLFAVLEKFLQETSLDELKAVEHLLLSNAQCFGPFVSVSELLKRRDESHSDFWGITRFSVRRETLIEPYFLSLSNRVLCSKELRNIVTGEEMAGTPAREKMNRVSSELAKCFSYATYVTLQDERPIRVYRFIPPFSVNAADYLIREFGMPLLPLAAFKTTQSHTFSICGNIIRELRTRFPDYPERMIFNYLRVVYPLSHLKNYPGILQVLPVQGTVSRVPEFRIAVKAHFFYADMLESAFPYLRNIPSPFDLLCTTCSSEVEVALREKAHVALPRMRQLKVEIVPNRGRDIGPWLTAFQGEEKQYDLILKFQTKKRLQQPNPFGQAWNRYNDLCILASESYVASIFRLFAEEEHLGIVFPPYPSIITVTSPQAYQGNSEMRILFEEAEKKCAPKAPVETAIPIFSAGTLFWYRPRAMRSLMNAGYTQESFPPEPLPPLTLAHAIERVIPYAAQSEGYYYKLAIPEEELLKGYQLMEDRLLSLGDGGGSAAIETPQSLSRNGFRTLARATVQALGLAVKKRMKKR